MCCGKNKVVPFASTLEVPRFLILGMNDLYSPLSHPRSHEAALPAHVLGTSLGRHIERHSKKSKFEDHLPRPNLVPHVQQ
jgi:hypothetical protein